jgi:hypothetical protein
MNLRLFFTLILIVQFCMVRGQSRPSPADSAKAAVGKTDSAALKPAKEPKPPYIHQFRVGFDISRIPFNIMYPSRQGYEIQADYALRGKLYLAAETGFGKGKIDYDNLKYTTTGYFFRVGVDNSFLDRLSPRDFDMAFVGIRYGMGIGKRNDAEYSVPSIFGPPATGSVPAQSFVVHWGELVAGIKVELWKGIFAGWNFRAKFLLNSGVFKELSPNYIPGYGKGDKSTAFDFNFNFSYALRWGKI